MDFSWGDLGRWSALHFHNRDQPYEPMSRDFTVHLPWGGDSWNLLRGTYVNHRIKEWYSGDIIVDIFIRVSRHEVSVSHT